MIAEFLNQFFIKRAAMKMHEHFKRKYHEYKTYQSTIERLNQELNEIRGTITEPDLAKLVGVLEEHKTALKNFEQAFIHDMVQCNKTVDKFEQYLK